MKMFMIYVLGLLLFLLYIEDIKSVIQNTYCHLYANPDKKVWRELSNIDHWLSINKFYNKTVRHLGTPLAGIISSTFKIELKEPEFS